MLRKILLLTALLNALLATLPVVAAPREDFDRLLREVQAAPQDNALRERVIAAALALKPPPRVPEEARRFLGRGQAAVELAKTAEEFTKAVEQFEAALRVAPWLADAYYNLGVVEEKAGRPGNAARSLKLYLLAAPTAADADAVRTRIYGLEYKAEQAAATQRQSDDKRRQEQSRQNAALQIGGLWSDSNGTQYRIDLNGNQFTITSVSHCHFGDCNDRRHVSRRYAYGTIDNGEIKGFVTASRTDASQVNADGRLITCTHPEQGVPFSLALEGGRQLKGRAKHLATNPACQPMVLIIEMQR